MKPDTGTLPTPSQTAGPFFHVGCTDHWLVASLVTPQTRGERIRLTCRVLDGDGEPVSDAMIEIWQADADGQYSHDQSSNATFGGFGRLPTDESGGCTFETIKPGSVAGNETTLQAPHINVSVFARGLLQRLATRIYFVQEAGNTGDPILSLVPAERRHTLMAQSKRPGEWNFDIHLCGYKETVFFDI